MVFFWHGHIEAKSAAVIASLLNSDGVLPAEKDGTLKNTQPAKSGPKVLPYVVQTRGPKMS